MKEPIYYSIIIPVYNSAKTLESLHNKIVDCMKKLNVLYEIIYVEDCGQDNSWEVLCSLKKNGKLLRGFRLANNFGQWSALLCGMEQANGMYIITMDDDLQYDEMDIIKLCEHREKNDLLLVYGIPQLVFESKLQKTRRDIRNFLVNFLFSKEITSSFRIFKRTVFLDSQNNLRSQLHFEAAEKLFVSPKYKDRIPVNFRQRTAGSSGYNILKKIRLLFVHGVEYYNATYITFLVLGFATIVFSMFLFFLFLVRRSSVVHDASYHLLTGIIFNLGATLVAIGIISVFLSRMFLIQKGKPSYIIAESI